MRAVIDTSVLVYLIDPDAEAPKDEKTGVAIAHCKERIEGLLDALNDREVEVILPTPVLSELLVKAGKALPEVLSLVKGKRAVRVEPFCMRAATENALLRRDEKSMRGKSTKKEVSFDLQVMAIARVHQAAMLYTDDGNFRARCQSAGIATSGIGDLPIPDKKRQAPLELKAGEPEEARARAAPAEAAVVDSPPASVESPPPA